MEKSINPLQIRTKEERIKLLTKLLEKSKNLSSASNADSEFIDWKLLVERTFIKLFGEPSIEVRAFRSLNFQDELVDFLGNENAMQHNKIFKQDFETVLKYINQYLEEAKEQPDFKLSSDNENVSKNFNSKKDFSKIQWQGTQKELGELFIELKNKGWINEINADLIQNSFSDSNTIKQILKPAKDNQGNSNYDQVYTKAYKPKFDLIRMKEKDK